jgi:hypothetical protein
VLQQKHIIFIILNEAILIVQKFNFGIW